MVGECSSGDTDFFFVILSTRKKKKPGSKTSAVSYLVPLHIKASVITIVLGPEKCYFLSLNMGAMPGDRAKMHNPVPYY